MIDADVKADPTSFFTYEQFQKAVDLEALASAASSASDKPVVNANQNPGVAIPGGAVPNGRAFPGGGALPGGGIMGGNAVPLLSFVRMWNASLTAQLDGTSPSTGTVSGGMGGIGGNRGGVLPGGAIPNGGAFPGGALPGGAIPNGGAFPGGGFIPGGDAMPGGGAIPDDNPAELHKSSSPSASLSPAEIALLTSAVLIMTGTILLLKRRRSLHAI
jgi:hypothetical protein